MGGLPPAWKVVMLILMNVMRGLFLVAVVLFFGTGISSAQQEGSDGGFAAPRTKKPKVDSGAVAKPSPYDINGVVAQAFKMKKPLELINPLAPPKYDKSEDISWDPDNPEKPQGVILLGIQW